MPWPPTVRSLRGEVTTQRSDDSLYRILQNAVAVVDRFELDEIHAEHHALQLAVVDVVFDALSSRTEADGAKVEHNHEAARRGILIELRRLRLVKLRRPTTTPAPMVPAAPARVAPSAPVRYLSYSEWAIRAQSTTLPIAATGGADQPRVELLLDDAAAWCASVIPGNLTRGGYLLLPAEVPPGLLAVCRQVSTALVTAWLSPRAEDGATCEAGAAARLKVAAQGAA